MTSFDLQSNTETAQTLNDGETGSVTTGITINVSSSRSITLAYNAAAPAGRMFTVNSSGTIQDTAASGRAIDTNATFASARTIDISNHRGATITSNNDVVRVNSDLASGSVATFQNDGTISNTGTGFYNGQAIDFNAVSTSGSSVTITNSTTGSITSADSDAIRPGQGGVVENSGQITSNAVATRPISRAPTVSTFRTMTPELSETLPLAPSAVHVTASLVERVPRSTSPTRRAARSRGGMDQASVSTDREQSSTAAQSRGRSTRPRPAATAMGSVSTSRGPSQITAPSRASAPKGPTVAAGPTPEKAFRSAAARSITTASSDPPS